MFKFRKVIILGYLLIIGFFIFNLIKKNTNHELQCGTAFCTSSTAKEINNLINQKVEVKDTLLFMLQVVYGSKKIKATLEKKIDLELNKVNQVFAHSKIKFVLNRMTIVKETSLTVDEFYEDNVKKNNYIKSLDKKNINLIFVENGSVYSGFTTVPKTSFLNYLTPDNSYNSIFVSANLEYPLATIAHELGHFFGLQHTFGSSKDPYSTKEDKKLANCSTEGDFICDTPPDNNTGALTNCDIVVPIDTSNLEKEIVYPSVLNFMSYTPSKCRSEFTPMQYSLMKKFALTYRKKLIIK